MRRIRSILLAVAAAVPAQQTQESGRVPSEAELAAAQPAAAAAIAQRLVGALGGDVGRGVSELLAAAFGHADDATSYLLWQQAIALADCNGRVDTALMAQRALAPRFGLDPEASGAALLRRFAGPDADALRLANVAFVALDAADAFAATDGEAAMLAYYDIALRCAVRCDHARVFEHVRDQLGVLRAPRELAARVSGAQLARGAGASFAWSLQRGQIEAVGALCVDDLAPWFDLPPDLEPTRELAGLTAAEWQGLAARTEHPTLGTGCRRCARAVLARRYADAGQAERRELAREIAAACEGLATADGLTRLRFGDARLREQLVYANGAWRIEDGALRGRSTGANNFATHRVRFGRIDAVVIRGGIASDAGLNFRCKVGDVNLLLNWEVEPQNHLWCRGECHRTTPPALVPGQQHEILIFTDGARCHVAIDGAHWWTVPGGLCGTVTVYPALGSEIFVREILIDGEPDGLVDGPVGTLM